MGKKKIIQIFGMSFFSLGIIFLMNAGLNFTGAFMSDGSFAHSFGFILGIVFLIAGIIIFSTSSMALENKVTNYLTSSIKESPSLLRLTLEAVKNENVQREMDHLVQQLAFGNFGAGAGYPGHIEGTDIFYLRGHNGARLYYQKTGKENYNIVAKSAKGKNQDQVMDKLREIHKQKGYKKAA